MTQKNDGGHLETLSLSARRAIASNLTMRDRFFFPLIALLALAMIALAMVWPQGLGAPSPAPFGHAVGPAAGL